MTMMFTRYFLFRKELYEKWQSRPYIYKVSEVFSVIPSFHNVIGERTRIMRDVIFLDF